MPEEKPETGKPDRARRIYGMWGVALALLLAGCTELRTVSKTDLDEAKQHWKEPKVSAWYYMGTSGGYHHYVHCDLSERTVFRVSEHHLVQKDPFPYTRNRGKWRMMPWGARAARKALEKMRGKKSE